jgi:hypothetical protein
MSRSYSGLTYTMSSFCLCLEYVCAPTVQLLAMDGITIFGTFKDKRMHC